MSGKQIEGVAQSSGASCRALLSLPNTLIVHFSEEMSSYSCCQHSRCSADVFGEQCQVTGKWMPKMTYDSYLRDEIPWFPWPSVYSFTSGLSVNTGLGETQPCDDWGTRGLGCLCLFHKIVSGIMKKNASV